MSITYKWSVEKMQVVEDNLVNKVNLIVTANDESNNLTASAAYTRNLVRGNTFTQFNELTEQQVLDWCFETELIDVTDLDGNVIETIIKHLKDEGEAQVTGQIERQLSQKQSEPALPWLEIPA